MNPVLSVYLILPMNNELLSFIEAVNFSNTVKRMLIIVFSIAINKDISLFEYIFKKRS